MVIARNILLCSVVFAVMAFYGWDDLTAADPNAKKDVQVEAVPDAGPHESPKTVVKNPHGFLQYDGTGYRVVTRDVKPDKASQVRLKPVTTKEGGTVYVLEVVDEKQKAAAEEPKAPEEGPRLAVERLENLESRKGVGPVPVKEHKADYGVGVKVSESSDILVGRQVILEREENKNLDSRDDGWRFRFKTNF